MAVIYLPNGGAPAMEAGTIYPDYASLPSLMPDGTTATTSNGRAWIYKGGYWIIHAEGDYSEQALIDTPGGDDVASVLADGWTSVKPIAPTDVTDGIGLITNTRIQHSVPLTGALVGFWEIRIDAHHSGTQGAGVFIFVEDNARRPWISLTYGGVRDMVSYTRTYDAGVGTGADTQVGFERWHFVIERDGQGMCTIYDPEGNLVATAKYDSFDAVGTGPFIQLGSAASPSGMAWTLRRFGLWVAT